MASHDPSIAVVISSYGRAQYLPELFARLQEQELPRHRFEVVIVDNGSHDETWTVLNELAIDTDLQLTVARLDSNRGPGGGRNAGVEYVRAPLIAFTDDDCLPTPGWLAGLLRAFGNGVAVVQGRVQPDPLGLPGCGPWDHMVDIPGMTPWFETANVAYRREAFMAVGGFDEQDSLTSRQSGGRAFGEDAVLAGKVIEAGGGARFAQDAVVHHRVVPRNYRKLARDWRIVAGFPGLIQRSQFAADSLWMGVFLNQNTAVFDLAVLSVSLAALTRRPYLALGALPWARRRWHFLHTTSANRAETVVRLVQRAGVEGVGLLSLIEGSVIHRRLVL